MAGESGKILHTVDGGDSWTFQHGDSSASFESVFFVDSQHGWIGGSKNTLGTTTDGGESWRWQHPVEPSERTIMSIGFTDRQKGWIVDNFGGVRRTDDGGRTWTLQTSGTGRAITSVHFENSREGWAVATNREVLHTTDGGARWILTTLDSLKCAKVFTLIYMNIFSYNSRIWIGTTSMASNRLDARASIVYSPDAGRSWRCEWYPLITMFGSICFVDENVGWAATNNGILHTTDGGDLWTTQFPVPRTIFVGMCFVGRSHGWALTSSGSIYRYRAH